MELDIALGRAHDLENSFPSSKFLKIQVVGLVTQWKHHVEAQNGWSCSCFAESVMLRGSAYDEVKVLAWWSMHAGWCAWKVVLVVLNHILSTLSVTSSFCWDCNDRILTAYLSIAGARGFLVAWLPRYASLTWKWWLFHLYQLCRQKVERYHHPVSVPLIPLGIYLWRSFLRNLILQMLLGVQGWI